MIMRMRVEQQSLGNTLTATQGYHNSLQAHARSQGCLLEVQCQIVRRCQRLQNLPCGWHVLHVLNVVRKMGPFAEFDSRIFAYGT